MAQFTGLGRGRGGVFAVPNYNMISVLGRELARPHNLVRTRVAEKVTQSKAFVQSRKTTQQAATCFSRTSRNLMKAG